MVVGPPGTYHSANAVAAQAQLDLTTAHNNAAGQGSTIAMPQDMVGMTLVGGVYNRAAAMELTGALTLDGEDDPTKVWVFQAGTTLITGSGASVELIRGANPCNVFWQVGSSATLGTTTRFVGTIMADQTITMNTAATLRGRALASIGAVNLHNNVIRTDDCTGDVEVAPGTTTPPTTGGEDDTDDGTEGGTGSTDGTDGTGGTSGDTDGENGGTGSAGNGVTPTAGNQVTRVPQGAVDTGYAGPNHALDGVLVSGVAVTAFLGGLALVAVRRRGRV